MKQQNPLHERLRNDARFAELDEHYFVRMLDSIIGQQVEERSAAEIPW